MRDIADYMTENRETRRSHIDCSLPCHEYGGNGSTEFKGLLAYYLETTIPCRGQGYRILLCHACGNAKCSNVRHLYWGTPKDNTQDSKEHGTWTSQYERTLAKYGQAGMREIASRAGYAASEARSHQKPQEYWESFRPTFDAEDKTARGWVQRLSARLGVSHTQVRRIAVRLGHGSIPGARAKILNHQQVRE